ncbi:MAG: hypothetical protein JXB14_05420 [Candidatus Altiarchaeota archaeon]|nr:hypothetical protein [Candidatus Altiarchaeota archaeon]
MNTINQKLLKEAKELFTKMIQEKDVYKRKEIKIEIYDRCLRGKFDYFTFVYRPMVLALKGASKSVG